MNEVNVKEIDARIMMLQQQRDEALNRAVLLAGRLAVVESELEELKKAEKDSGVPAA